MVGVDWGQSLKENCFATFLTPTTPTGGGSATVKLARWCGWTEWRPGYSSPVSPGLLSHVDSIRKFSMVPQRNLSQAGSAGWRTVTMLWCPGNWLLGWTVLWLMRILLWFEVSAYVVLPRRHMWRQKYYGKGRSLAMSPPKTIIRRYQRNTHVFHKMPGQSLLEASHNHCLHCTIPGWAMEAEWIYEEVMLLYSSSQRKKEHQTCLPPSSASRFKRQFKFSIPPSPEKGKTNIWLEYCIYITEHLSYKKETTVFRDLFFFPSEAQNIPPPC